MIWRNLWADTAPHAAWEYGRYRRYTVVHWAAWWLRSLIPWWLHGRPQAVRQAASLAAWHQENLDGDVARLAQMLASNPSEIVREHAQAIAALECRRTIRLLTQSIPYYSGAAGWDGERYRPVPVSWFPPIPGRDQAAG